MAFNYQPNIGGPGPTLYSSSGRRIQPTEKMKAPMVESLEKNNAAYRWLYEEAQKIYERMRSLDESATITRDFEAWIINLEKFHSMEKD